VSYYKKAYHLIIKPGYFGNHGEICMLLNTSCNNCTVQTPMTTKTSESHMNGSSFVSTTRIFMIVIVHMIGNRKLKFTIIWPLQTEVCSVPYLHKNEFINAYHTMFVITMDEHTPTPVLGGGGKQNTNIKLLVMKNSYMLENNIPEHHIVLENSLNFSPKDAVVQTTFLRFYFNFI